VRGLGTVKEGTVAGGSGGRRRGHGADAFNVVASRSQTLKSRARGGGVLRGNLFTGTEAGANLDAKTVDARRPLGAQTAAATASTAGVAGRAHVR